MLPLIWALEAMAIIAFFQLLLVIYFILFVECHQSGKRITWKTVKKPVNVAFVLGNMCLIGLYTTLSYCLQEFGVMIGTGLWSSLALLSKGIVGTVFPSYTPYLTTALHLSPILIYSQIIPEILYKQDILPEHLLALVSSLLVSANGLFVITFDIITVISFTSFLNRTVIAPSTEISSSHPSISLPQQQTATQTATATQQTLTRSSSNSTTTNPSAQHDPQFRIVARHGIIANGLCFLALGTYATTFAITDTLTAQALTTATCCLFDIVFWVLFSMKVSLHVHGVRKRVVKEALLEKTLGKEALLEIRRGSIQRITSFVRSTTAEEVVPGMGLSGVGVSEPALNVGASGSGAGGGSGFTMQTPVVGIRRASSLLEVPASGSSAVGMGAGGLVPRGSFRGEGLQVGMGRILTQRELGSVGHLGLRRPNSGIGSESAIPSPKKPQTNSNEVIAAVGGSLGGIVGGNVFGRKELCNGSSDVVIVTTSSSSESVRKEELK
ncbi:hypothetical protein HDU79_012037 [Rhizoclosmatium sp. JEL0117]|nr:hypothetical protein HDU79_012037 [Rhizoclosmatium sp. JEL0117]